LTFNRQPEDTDADEEGGSSRLSTMMVGGRRRTTEEGLPGAASMLPCCRSSHHLIRERKISFPSSPRQAGKEDFDLPPKAADPAEPASLLMKLQPDPGAVVAHHGHHQATRSRNLPAPPADAAKKLPNGITPVATQGQKET
jgi:hypothetical protein